MNMLTKSKQKTKGFTLIELMITVVIIGVIAGIGFPSYQSSIRKSKRTEAKAALLELMARQEQYFSEKREYATTLEALNWNGTTSLGATGDDGGSYGMSITPGGAAGIIEINAEAIGRQTKDSIESFGLDSVGRKWHYPKDGGKETGWD